MYVKIYLADTMIKRIRIKNLRSIIRDFQKLRKNNNLYLVNEEFSHLKKNILLDSVKFLDVEIDSIRVNNYISMRFFRGVNVISLQKSKSGNCKGQIYLMPKKWRFSLCERGNKINNLLSSLVWKSICLLYLFYSLYNYYKIVASIILTNVKMESGSSIYLHKLSYQNIPASDNDSTRTVIGYFSKYRNYQNILAQLDNKISQKGNFKGLLFVPNPFVFLPKTKLIDFSFYTACLFGAGFWDIFFRDGVLAVTSTELQLKKLAKLMPEKFVSSEYAFHNTNFSYQPAWTNIMEEKGAKITLYFYSVNCLPFHIDGKLNEINFGYENMTWPNFISWNKEFNYFLERNTVNIKSIEILPPVEFMDKKSDRVETKGSIVVFDVTPSRAVDICKLGIITDYYLSSNQDKFFSDILTCAAKHNRKILIKQKRKNTVTKSKYYKKIFKQLQDHPMVELIDPDISAHKLIEGASGVISMPFTSTAHIAKFYDVPSVYFDYTKRISNSEPTALGIEVLKSITELDNWMANLKTSKH